MFPVHIAGDGLTLRVLEPADARAMFAYLSRTEVYEATSSGWTLGSVQQFIESNREGMAEGRWAGTPSSRMAPLPSPETSVTEQSRPLTAVPKSATTSRRSTGAAG